MDDGGVEDGEFAVDGNEADDAANIAVDDGGRGNCVRGVNDIIINVAETVGLAIGRSPVLPAAVHTDVEPFQNVVVDLSPHANLEKKRIVDATVKHRGKLDASASDKRLALNDDDFVLELAFLFLIPDDDTTLNGLTARCRASVTHARIAAGRAGFVLLANGQGGHHHHH